MLAIMFSLIRLWDLVPPAMANTSPLKKLMTYLVLLFQGKVFFGSMAVLYFGLSHNLLEKYVHK